MMAMLTDLLLAPRMMVPCSRPLIVSLSNVGLVVTRNTLVLLLVPPMATAT